MGRIASATFWVCVSILVVAPLAAWAALAFWFRLPAPDWARFAAPGAVVLVALFTIAALFTRFRWAALSIFALGFACIILWWGTIRPPSDGDWAPDVARQTTETLDGD